MIYKICSVVFICVPCKSCVISILFSNYWEIKLNDILFLQKCTNQNTIEIFYEQKFKY